VAVEGEAGLRIVWGEGRCPGNPVMLRGIVVEIVMTHEDDYNDMETAGDRNGKV
jgi:hypothetical protein